MTEYERGQTARIKVYLRDINDNLVDPDQDTDYKITITIRDVTTGTTKVDSVTMTRESQGVFYYDWETAVDDTIGQYSIEVIAMVNSKQVVNRDYIDLVEVSL